MSVPILLRRDTLAQWTAVNPILLSGEVGIILDANGIAVAMKIGDGVKNFVALAEFKPGGDVASTQEDLEILENTVTNIQTSKEDSLPEQADDDQILSTTLEGVRSWITLPDYLLPDGSLSMDINYSPTNSNDIAVLSTVESAVQNLEYDLGTPMEDNFVLASSTTGSRTWVKMNEQRVFSDIIEPTKDIGSNGDIFNVFTEKGLDYGINATGSYLLGQDTPDTWVFDTLVNTLEGTDFVTSFGMIFDRTDVTKSVITLEQNTGADLYNISINSSTPLIIEAYKNNNKYIISYDLQSANFIDTLANMFDNVDASSTLTIQTQIRPLNLVPAKQYIKSQDLWQEVQAQNTSSTSVVKSTSRKTRFSSNESQAEFLCSYEIDKQALVFVEGILQLPKEYIITGRLVVLKTPLVIKTDVLVLD